VTSPATLSAPALDLVAALRQVPGIGAVTADRSGALRIDLADDADAETVRSSVLAVTEQRFGPGASTVTAERIGPVTADARLALEELVLTDLAPERTAAEVSMTLEGRSATGAAEAAVASEAVVTAILLALEELTEDAVIGTIESARIDSDGIARVRLRLDVDGTEEAAEAEAAVLRSAPQAIVRAVLTAVEPHLPG
jgi:hypothetical protein